VAALRVGVIGAGGVAAEHLHFLTARTDVEVLGVVDRSPATARWAAQRWGVADWFTDHHALLAARPDVVHVLTPPPTHAAIARDALDARAHVIAEKPLVPTRAELVALHEVAQAADRWLLEDQNYRWNDGVLWLSDVVGAGRLGEVRDVEVAMALPVRAGGVFADRHLPSPAHLLPGGALHDFLPHLAYLGLLFAPGLERAERITATWSNLGGDDGLWRADDLDATIVDGPVNLRLRFSSHTRPDRFEITVRGTEGDAAVDLFQPFERLRVTRRVGDQLTPLVNQAANGAGLLRQVGRNFGHKLTHRTPYHGMWRFLDLVYDRLHDGGDPPLSFEQIDASTTLVDRLVERAP
jgi:predicted dehydrogenase